jgi:D-alanyl-D-alanine carboxypeptidase
MTSRRPAALLLFVVLFSACMAASRVWAAPQTHAGTPSIQTRIDALLAPYVAKKLFWGSVEVSHAGSPLYRKGFGYANIAWSIQNTPDTVYEIASLTKQFTGAAILQLADAKKIGLDDPVGKYYADAPSTWSAITIRQLANHTSGLPNNDLKDFYKGLTATYTPEELIKTFRDRPLVATPGTKWAYTNTEYYLLAYIIEKVSGEPYGRYLREHIFTPAGMTHSTFTSTLAVVPRAAQGYTRDGATFRMHDPFDRTLEIGAGGIQTTVDDMDRWNTALDRSTLLSPSSKTAMFTPSVPGGYGFGWFVENTPLARYTHEGSDPGFAAFEIRLPATHDVIVVLSNVDDAPVREIAAKIQALLVAK